MKTVKHNSLLNSEQHGFGNGLPSITNLFIGREKWIEDLGNKKLVDIFYAEFSEVFNKLPRSRLLLNLENIGISEPHTKWTKGPLIGRRKK